MENGTPISEFTCPKCGRSFNRKGWYDRHVLTCVVAQVQANPDTAGPTSAAPTFGPTGTVAVGTRLLLNGKAWWWDNNPAAPGWKQALAAERTVVVESRESQPTGMFLVCGSNDSAVKWTFPESECFGNGIAKILDATPAIPAPAPVEPEPVKQEEPVLPAAPEPAKDKLETLIQESAAQAEEPVQEAPKQEIPKVEEPVQAEEPVQVEASAPEAPNADVVYTEAAEKYVSANEAKLAAEKAFKKVSANTRETIEEYVRARGTESAPGKEDFLVEAYGFKAHLVRTPGQLRVERDEGGILQWALASGNVSILKTVVNVEAWEELKSKGFVPQEVIARFEKPVQDEDKFALKIARAKEEK